MHVPQLAAQFCSWRSSVYLRYLARLPRTLTSLLPSELMRVCFADYLWPTLYVVLIAIMGAALLYVMVERPFLLLKERNRSRDSLNSLTVPWKTVALTCTIGIVLVELSAWQGWK